MSPGHLFTLLCIAWGVSELWIGWRRRSADTARTRDAGTLRLLLITIYVCIALAVWLATTGVGRFAQPWRDDLFWIGLAMMAAGLLFRWWSIRVLAQYFTVDVAIRDDHRIVRDGPYRVLRHPSYTGALATFYGFALALGNWASLLVIVVPVTLTFLWRMRVEERVLADAFPQEYPEYARRTKRLLPYLW
jgi:protein-S-isoprenylcysteine O-methyltransferase